MREIILTFLFSLSLTELKKKNKAVKRVSQKQRLFVVEWLNELKVLKKLLSNSRSKMLLG